MPSSPPSLLPFGTTLFNNGKYILGVLTNMLSVGKLSKSLSKPALSGNIPLDIGLLPSADTPNAANDASLEGALQKTAETVASSVQAILGAGPRSRVLIFGSESYTRAKCLSETTFTGKPLVLLQDTLVNVVSSKRQGRDGIYWSDDADVLPLCQANFFDVIICFNIANGRDDVSALLKKLDRVLRPGGCLAGTGVFKGPFASEDEGDGDQMTLKSFRDAVEDVGFFMHVSTDLSLEGNVILKVSDDLRGVKDASPVDMVRSGQLLCARFLSTKNNKTGAYRMPQRVSAVIKPKQRKQSREGKFREIESLDDGIYGKTVEELLRVERKIREREALWELKSSSVAPTLPGLGLEGSSSSSRRQRSDSGAGKEMKGGDWLGIGAAASAAADAIEQEKSLASQVTGVVITGVSLGLPNQMHPDRPVFDPKNFGSIFRGENFISQLESADKQEMLSMNIVQVSKKEGKRVETTLSKESEVLGVASRMAGFDLAKEYGVPPVVVEALDTTYQLAIAAGIEALRDAGIKLSKPETLAGGRTTVMGLPPTMQDETGVIFASSFPSLDSAVEEVSKYAANKARMELLSELKQQLQEQGKSGESGEGYQYNRKLLFKLLVMANSQLAELINARGPNTHINSACSGTTQAIALAEDWIRAGRCKRVIVVGADNPTTSNLFKFIGTGFLALGAATTSHKVEDAAIPFDKRRKGMILGAGAVGLVVEATSAALARNAAIKSEILGSAILNSAFHACLMDGQHIASEFRRFIEKMAKEHGLDRTELAKDCIYFSHETGTSANGGCAKVEVDALAAAFGEKSKPDILIANTKGFTGHPMAVGVEDVVAVASLAQGLVPPVANLQTVDPCLGDIQLARGGTHSRNYALRFAAGFGSQFTMLLMRKWESQKSRARALSLARASPVLRHRQAARRPSPPHISIPIVVRVSGNTAISSSSAKLSPVEGLEDCALSPEPLSRELSGLKLS